MRISRDRVIPNGPRLPLCVETKFSNSTEEPAAWDLNLGGLLFVLQTAVNKDEVVERLQSVALLFKDNLLTAIQEVSSKASALPQTLRYGNIAIQRHDLDTVIITNQVNTLALHLLSLMPFISGVIDENEQLDMQRLLKAPLVWRTNTFSGNHGAAEEPYILTDAAVFKLDKAAQVVSIFSASEEKINPDGVSMQITALVDAYRKMLHPMYQIGVLPDMQKYLDELILGFGV